MTESKTKEPPLFCSMQFQININIPAIEPSIKYTDKILLMGSCFTEHIGNYLQEVKFNVLQNPSGILFDPASVCFSLQSYIQPRLYNENDLFYLNEAWHSWQHHSRFSHPYKEVALQGINQAQQKANAFLKDADWLIITLGSSFVYKLVNVKDNERKEVANCHKAPAQTFNKHLLSVEEIVTNLDNTLHQLFYFNPKLKVIFTISPVRHLRDGVIENNRSKARLIEAVHHLVSKFNNLYYFPAYELVIDVLRDYRFYDIDMAHPNFMATQFVLEKFTESAMNKETIALMNELKQIAIAKKHKPFNPSSHQHKQFMQKQYEKVEQLKDLYSYLNMEEEISYFKNQTGDDY